jgi:hypothetical protein
MAISGALLSRFNTFRPVVVILDTSNNPSKHNPTAPVEHKGFTRLRDLACILPLSKREEEWMSRKMKPRIRRQTHGWAVEQGVHLIGTEITFRATCAFAGQWVRDDWKIV